MVTSAYEPDAGRRRSFRRGVIADHLKSVDWLARRAERIGRSPESLLIELRAKLGPLLGF